MKEFTFRLKADVSYLEAQFKGGAEALKALAMQADKAEKKLEIFQEASTYLSQMDVMLGKIKKNYPDLFAQIFNGVDKQVKDAMAPFKQMPEVIGQALDNVGNKMQDVLSGKNKDATFSEVKEWAKSIEAAANALDIKVDLGFIEQAGASKKKVEGLVSVLKQLREAYHTTSDAAERANIAPIVPEVKPKRKRVPKKDTTVVEGSSGTGSGSATRHVENLTNSYIKLRNEIKKVKDGADFDKIIRDFKLTEDELGELENILYNTQDSLSDTMIKMREFLGSKFPEVSFENISDGIQKFLDIQNKLDSAETDEEFNKLSDEADEIRDSFVELSSAAESVFDGLMDGLSKDDAIKQLSDVFGVKMTQSFNNAEDAADGLGSEIKGTANEIENTIAKVKVLEDRLQEVLRNTKKHNIEFGVVLNGEDVSVRSGKGRGSTDGVQDVGNMLSSLEEYFINTHTHTTTSKYTNDEDMSVWANLKKYGVTDHNAIIGPDGATAFDFSKVSDEDMQKVIAKVKELGKSGNVTEEQLQEIFLTLDAGYTDVVKHFDATQMDEFAKYILNVSNNADNSIAPLERFKNIVSYFSDGTVDFSKWTKEFESFSVDKAEELFNKMIKFKEGGKIVPIDASKKTMSDVLGGITSGQSLEGATGDTNELRGALEGVESAAEGVGVAISDMDDELREVLAQETGSLEQKLERLRDVADEYGKDINQRKRNSLESLIDKDNEGELTNSQEERLSELQEEIDEADEALTAFEEQYDKIILKLANGKKVEILPNDKGLRDLYKFMDESFGQEFNGIEITDVEFIRKVAQSLGTEIPQAASGASSAIDKVSQKTEDLAAEATAAKKTFDALTAEVNENWYNMSDIDIGRNTQGLDSSIDQLRLLADQGAITSEEMTKFEMAYRKAMDQLNMRKTSNEYDREAGQDALKYGGYEDGYQDGYNNARNDYHEELDAYQNTINELRQELAEAQNRITDRDQIGDSFGEESGAVKTNIQAEIDQLERLEKKIFEVKHAVEQKIQAFVNEKRAVDSSITSEITALDSLITKLNEVKAAVDSKSDAFKQEDGAVKDSVKQATKKKNTEKKEQEDAPNKEVRDANAQASAEAKENEELREQATLKDQLIKQQGTLNYLEKEAKGAESVLGDTWNDGQAEEYNQILALISEYKKSKKLLSEEELQGIRDVVSGYQQQKKAIDEVKAAEEKRAKDAKAAEEKAKNAYGAKELGKATSTMEKAYDYGAIYKDSTKVQTQLETVRQTYAQLEAAQKELANSTGVVTEEQKQAFRILVADFNKEYGTLNKIIKDSENLISKSRFTPVDVDPSVAADMNKLEAVMKQAVEAGEEGKVRFGQFNATLQTMEYQVKDTNGQWVTFLARLDSTGTKVVAANSAIKKTNTLLKDITSSTLSKMKSAIGNITGYDLIYRIINITKQGIQYVREIDSALTELKKVTDETEESYRNFLQTASKTAAAVGSTVKDITTMTADWSRLGYSMEQAASLAESTAVLLNVSEFSDANQASEALISTIQAYGYAADESMSVVDILNEVGNNFAVSSDGLATALQTSASALMSAGNDLNQSVALVAAANKVVDFVPRYHSNMVA